MPKFCVLFCSRASRHLHIEDVRWGPVFDRRCLRTIARVCCDYQVNSGKTRRRRRDAQSSITFSGLGTYFVCPSVACGFVVILHVFSEAGRSDAVVTSDFALRFCYRPVYSNFMVGAATGDAARHESESKFLSRMLFSLSIELVPH